MSGVHWLEDETPKLKYVKFVVSKGLLYAYFNIGQSNGRMSYMKLPAFGSDEFYNAYSQCLSSRKKPNSFLFSTDKFRDELKKAAHESRINASKPRGQVTYFIQCASGPIKIGVASSVPRRLASLQVSNHEPLEILATSPGGLDIEKMYHERFKEHRISGEWFSPHEEIVSEIERLNGARTKAANANRIENLPEKGGKA